MPAFDTVDHDILLSRLEHWVGIKDTALSWFKSYLKSRTLSVAIGQFSSSSVSLPYGVPQGSILGPLLFNLYMLPVGNIIRKYKISFHFYADDSQLYVPLKSRHSLQPLMDCLKDIKIWMANNFLQLNNEKTEVIIFGPSKIRNSIVSNLDSLTPYVTSRNVGVIFDSELCLEKQISSVVKNSFYQLRIISRLKSNTFLSRLGKSYPCIYYITIELL